MSDRVESRGFFREPLVHFLVIGLIVFGLHSFWSAQQSKTERTISISAEEIERLTTIWAGEAGREPTSEDVRGVMADYVREEVLYREALRLGLDRDDTIIRRRLAQKMGFLVNRYEPPTPLSDEDLRAAFAANRQAYAQPQKLTFKHVPFNFRSGEEEAQDAEMRRALEALSDQAAKVNPAKLGDPFLLSRAHVELSEIDVARLFGRDFAREVFALEVGRWSEPLRSRLAWHLVRVERRDEGSVPAFEDVIEIVRERETARLIQEKNEAEMTKLLDRYQVILNSEPS